jgi:hypothetical protein
LSKNTAIVASGVGSVQKAWLSNFRANLLKQLDKFDDARFTKEKENEMRKLWAEFSP